MQLLSEQLKKEAGQYYHSPQIDVFIAQLCQPMPKGCGYSQINALEWLIKQSHLILLSGKVLPGIEQMMCDYVISQQQEVNL